MEPTAIPPSTPASGGTVIHIGPNSQIGILNTGQIHKIEGNIITLRQSGAEEIAAAFKALAEAIGNSQELAPQQAKEALELVEALSAEAAKPPERRTAASLIKGSLTALTGTIATVGPLAQAWNTWGPQIAAFFRIPM